MRAWRSPISSSSSSTPPRSCRRQTTGSSSPRPSAARARPDRKSTRLNSSHSQISYAVFCLKKKRNKLLHNTTHLPFYHPSHTLLTQLNPTIHVFAASEYYLQI